MSPLRDLFGRRESPSIYPAAACGRPAGIPDGLTHVEYVAERAIEAFRESVAARDPIVALSRQEAALANVWHALYVALSKREQVSEARALQLYRDGIRAAEVWGGR